MSLFARLRSRRKAQLRIKVTLLGGVFLAGLAAAPETGTGQTAAGNGHFEKTVQPFLGKNCAGCHNAKLKTADLDITSAKTAAAIGHDPEIWEKVMLRLQNGTMPPKGFPRPAQADVDSITKWLDQELTRAEQATKPDPGKVTARRLNRTEYNNTIRDLLGVTFQPADDFPQDDSGYGFDNIGDVLSLSPVLMERYLAASEKIISTLR